MGKAPAVQFYVADYLKDTRSLSLSAKGAWQDLLCYMWIAKTRGLLSKTWGEYSRMIGASLEETKKAIMELIEGDICDVRINNQNVTCNADVTNCNKKVTLINRRMYREAQELEKIKLRVQRHRDKKASKQESNADVTVPSSSTSSSSLSSKTKENKKRKKFLSSSFDIFWKAYPGTKTDKKKCFEKWKLINPDHKLFDKIIKAIQEQKAWRAKAKPDDFRPPWKNPHTWLNGECWNDEVGQEKKTGSYKKLPCPNCNHVFERNLDKDEHCCPKCGTFLQRQKPPKDAPVEVLTDELAKKVSF